jgi:hypothetical protein
MKCQAIQERRELTSKLQLAAGIWDLTPLEGTEEELMRAFSVLQGIVNEYQNGGDQIVENCTCGQHIKP